MKLELEDEDIQPKFQKLYPQQIRFHMLTEKAKRAIRVVGTGLVGKGAFDGCFELRPSKEEKD